MSTTKIEWCTHVFNSSITEGTRPTTESRIWSWLRAHSTPPCIMQSGAAMQAGDFFRVRLQNRNQLGSAEP